MTLSASDVVLTSLLDTLAATPLARDLVIRAAVYRRPVDETALVWQLVKDEPDPDPDRDARIGRVQAVIDTAGERLGSTQVTSDDLDLTADEIAAYQLDIQAVRRPPPAPEKFGDALKRAVEAGLIAPLSGPHGSTRYVVHRWTATALRELDRDACVRAHERAARYWRWRVRVISQTSGEQLEQLLEARYHHRAAGETDVALVLSDNAVNQLRSWGQFGRATQVCRETLSWVSADSAHSAKYEHQLGMIAQARGVYASAEKHLARALRLRQRLGDELGAASSLAQIAHIAYDRGDYEGAEQHYIAALETFQRCGHQHSIAGIHHHLGQLSQSRGDYDTAEQRYNRALGIMSQLGDKAGVAASQYQLGVLAHIRGDYDAAEQYCEQALQTFALNGNLADSANAYHELGTLANNRGNYHVAEEHYICALQIHEQLGDHAGVAATHRALGGLAHDRLDYDSAARYYMQALQTYERLGMQTHIAGAHHQLGILAQDQGDFDTAEQYYTRALQNFTKLGTESYLAKTHAQLGILAYAKEDYETAEHHYAQALKTFTALGDQAGLATSHHQLGMLAHDRGDYGIAEQCYTHAVRILERLGDLAGLARTYSQLGILLTQTGKPRDAVALSLRVMTLCAHTLGGWSLRDLSWLKRQHRLIGGDAFAAALAANGDTELAQALPGLLEQISEPPNGSVGAESRPPSSRT